MRAACTQSRGGARRASAEHHRWRSQRARRRSIGHERRCIARESIGGQPARSQRPVSDHAFPSCRPGAVERGGRGGDGVSRAARGWVEEVRYDGRVGRGVAQPGSAPALGVSIASIAFDVFPSVFFNSWVLLSLEPEPKRAQKHHVLRQFRDSKKQVHHVLRGRCVSASAARTCFSIGLSQNSVCSAAPPKARSAKPRGACRRRCGRCTLLRQRGRHRLIITASRV